MDWDAALVVDIDFDTQAGRRLQDPSRNTSSSYAPIVIVRTFSFFLMEQGYARNAGGNLNGANDFLNKNALLPLTLQKEAP